MEPYMNAEEKSGAETAAAFESGADLMTTAGDIQIYSMNTKEAVSAACQGTAYCVRDPRAFEYEDYEIMPYWGLFRDGKIYALLHEATHQFRLTDDSTVGSRDAYEILDALEWMIGRLTWNPVDEDGIKNIREQNEYIDDTAADIVRNKFEGKSWFSNYVSANNIQVMLRAVADHGGNARDMAQAMLTRGPQYANAILGEGVSDEDRDAVINNVVSENKSGNMKVSFRAASALHTADNNDLAFAHLSDFGEEPEIVGQEGVALGEGARPPRQHRLTPHRLPG